MMLFLNTQHIGYCDKYYHMPQSELIKTLAPDRQEVQTLAEVIFICNKLFTDF